MKVSLIFYRISNGGGAYQLIHLARELMKHGYDVVVYTYYKPEETFAKTWLEGLVIRDCGIPFPSQQKREWQPIGLLRYLGDLCITTYRLTRLLWRDSHEILQPHEWLAQWVAAFLKFKNRNMRVIWMCNDVWHIPGNEERPERRILFKLVHLWLIAPLDRWLTAQTDIITVLDHRIEKICKHYYRKTKVKVVRSGIDLTQYKKLPLQPNARKRLGLDEHTWVWLCFAIFYKHRRYEDVVKAFANLKQMVKHPMKLVIAGSDSHDPAYAQQIRLLVKKLKLEKSVVIDTRYVSQKEKFDYLVAADTLIYPHEKQTWGLIVIEAMAAGRTCIVSSGAGVHEIISDGETGLIYPVGNGKALTRSMKTLITNKKLTTQIGQNALKQVRSQFSWTAYARQMETFFTKEMKG